MAVVFILYNYLWYYFCYKYALKVSLKAWRATQPSTHWLPRLANRSRLTRSSMSTLAGKRARKPSLDEGSIHALLANTHKDLPLVLEDLARH